MSAFVFQSKGHRYTLDGVRLPSVTECIREAGLTPSMDFVSDWHLNRGSQVHAATALFDQEDLDESVLDAALRGRLEAWKAFRAATVADFAITEIEKPRHSPLLRFAGTPDRVGVWRGRPCIVEIKSGKPDPSHGIQTAAYALLASAVERLGVYLADDGTFKVVTYTDRNDAAVFTAALTCWHWRAANGLLTSEAGAR